MSNIVQQTDPVRSLAAGSPVAEAGPKEKPAAEGALAGALC